MKNSLGAKIERLRIQGKGIDAIGISVGDTKMIIANVYFPVNNAENDISISEYIWSCFSFLAKVCVCVCVFALVCNLA